MTDKPIPFSGPMIRALLDGRKTQTRRVLKPQPSYGVESVLGPEWYEPEVVDRRGELVPGKPCWGVYDKWGEWGTKVPYMPGDRLWVKEAYTAHWGGPCNGAVEIRHGAVKQSNGSVVRLPHELDQLWAYYRADGVALPLGKRLWQSPRFMPRWASRLTLLVTAVRVQRVQEISTDDCLAEGIDANEAGLVLVQGSLPLTAKAAYRGLWNHLNAKRGYGWDANPWVVAVTFTVHVGNIDTIEVPA